MNKPRFAQFICSVVVVPMALVIGAAGPAASAQPDTTFGSHVSSCAQLSTGFSGLHNPSHHRGPSAPHAMTGMHC